MKCSVFDTILLSFILVLGLDPVNSLKLKVPIFSIILIYLGIKKKISNKLLLPFLLLLLIQFFSYISGRIFCEMPYEPSMAIQYITTSLTFILLLWFRDLSVFQKVIPVAFLVAAISIIGVSLMRMNSLLVSVMVEFQEAHGQPYMMADRELFGVNYPVFIYKSIPFVFIPASVFLYKSLKQKNKSDFVKSFILLASIVYCGNRTLILCAFFIAIVNIFVLFRNNKSLKLLSIVIFPIIIYYSVSVAMEMFTTDDANVESDEIRSGHLASYSSFFDQNPGTIFWGAGPGSMMYSKGLGEMTTQTEYTYLECFRYYGIFGGLIFIWFFFRPLIILYKRRKCIDYSTPVILGYFSFLLLCGSNPYLMGSDGLVMVLIATEFAYKNYYFKKKSLQICNHHNES